MRDIVTQDGDLTEDQLELLLARDSVAIDIETNGLDFRAAEIKTCQVAGDQVVILHNFGSRVPRNLVRLLESARVTKIFHYAPFDLRFMVAHWGARPRHVACTKAAAKIALPGRESSAYSLKPLLEEQLGVSIDKELQTSDWGVLNLSVAQQEYAAGDVLYLEALLGKLLAKAEAAGTSDLVRDSFAYLPSRVNLEILGVGDPLSY
jgi:ribonuclease D